MIPEDFKKMMFKIDRIYKQKGKDLIKPTKNEINERKIRHRYFVASKNIKIGDRFTINNLNMMRLKDTKFAIKADKMKILFNKKSKNNIKKGDIIKKNYVSTNY